MDVGELYNFVLLVILIGFLLGVGVLGLDKFSTSSGVTSAAQTAINATRLEISNIATNWLGLVVTIAILAIIITLVMRGFGGSRGR